MAGRKRSRCRSGPSASETTQPLAKARFLSRRTIDEFDKLRKIGEGGYGVVYRGQDKRSGEIVALKKLNLAAWGEKNGWQREIDCLMLCHHPSIVELKDVARCRECRNTIFLVMEYVEHDLIGFMEKKGQPFSESEVKPLMYQLLQGVKHMHDLNIFHRDIKTENILLNNQKEVKICDLGMCREFRSPPFTKSVGTLWYKAPEVLLGAQDYSAAIDMWSLGCVMAELLSMKPLFKGSSELDQLSKIFKIFGAPGKLFWPGYPVLLGGSLSYVRQSHDKL